MKKTFLFSYKEQSKQAYRYQQVFNSNNNRTIGDLSISKKALGEKPPPNLRIIIEFGKNSLR